MNMSSEQRNGRNGPIISLNKVSLRYDRGPEVLSDLDLELANRSFTFLTGASGAGKSSLLKLIYLALKPTRGLISLFGQDIDQSKPRDIQRMKRRIGVVSQDFGLIPHLTAFENTVLPLRATHRNISHYSGDARELLHWVGLGDKMQAYPLTLSGGEQQKLAIARAVITKPELLIADEPTGNVDPQMGQRLLKLFAEMNRTGTTILIATHDVALMKGISADVLTLSSGQLSRKRHAL